MIYWLVTLRCFLVNSLCISDFAELIHCPWKMFSCFFPSVPMLLEAEGDHWQGHYLYFPAAGGGVTLLPLLVSGCDKVSLVCCAWGTPERGADGRVGMEGELFHVS